VTKKGSSIWDATKPTEASGDMSWATCFKRGLFFDLQDGGHMFIRNIWGLHGVLIQKAELCLRH
jgi:hypothetical protein